MVGERRMVGKAASMVRRAERLARPEWLAYKIIGKSRGLGN
jgi:hypothetical protein